MIVVDSNVLVSALRSRNGASFRLLAAMLRGEITFAVSAPVILEYEDVLKRPGILGQGNMISPAMVDTLLDGLCARAQLTRPRFRFRPFTNDPKDDLFVECALAANADCIVSHDQHFQLPALAAFGVRALSPGEWFAEQDGGLR